MRGNAGTPAAANLALLVGTDELARNQDDLPLLAAELHRCRTNAFSARCGCCIRCESVWLPWRLEWARASPAQSAGQYNAAMEPASIRAFADRDWAAVAASKTRYWADRFRDEGWAPAWHASNALLLDVRRARADYPSDDERERDRAAHLQLRRRLDRVVDAFARR
jgi:hypothetical protein